MNNFYNDPLGAMNAVNTSLKAKVKTAAENIKNNENLKQGLVRAKEKAQAAGNTLSTNANYYYE